MAGVGVGFADYWGVGVGGWVGSALSSSTVISRYWVSTPTGPILEVVGLYDPGL